MVLHSIEIVSCADGEFSHRNNPGFLLKNPYLFERIFKVNRSALNCNRVN